MGMTIQTEHDLGAILYLRTDSDQKERMLIQILHGFGGTTYRLVCGTEDSYHYPMEVSTERDILKATTSTD